MRQIRIVTFIIDADDPGSSLDSIIEDGTIAHGYTLEEYETESNTDAYWKLKKE